MAVVVDVMKTVGTDIVVSRVVMDMGYLHQHHRQEYCQKHVRSYLSIPIGNHQIAKLGYFLEKASSLNFILEQNSW